MFEVIDTCSNMSEATVCFSNSDVQSKSKGMQKRGLFRLNKSQVTKSMLALPFLAFQCLLQHKSKHKNLNNLLFLPLQPIYPTLCKVFYCLKTSANSKQLTVVTCHSYHSITINHQRLSTVAHCRVSLWQFLHYCDFDSNYMK